MKLIRGNIGGGVLSMRISEKLLHEQHIYFAGRQREMETLRKHALRESPEPWLHLYGQGGIGKSSLLLQFRREMKDACCYYVNGSRGIRRKEDVLAQLADQLPEPDQSELDEAEMVMNLMRRSQYTGLPVVLLLDAFEYWRPLEEWLTGWLQRFDDSVRIVTAGRHPLTGGWLRSEWNGNIHSVQLPALTHKEVESYAQKRGLLDLNRQTQLFRFSGGVPLAMTLAAELLLRSGENRPINRAERYRLVSILMNELLQGLEPSFQRLLEAASVYWRFNEERLAAVLEEEMSTEAFRQFIQMPFVIMMEEDWTLHDSIRSWALEDFMRRKPNAYEQMRRKGLEHIRWEEKNNPQLRYKLHLDKMNLHDDPLVRSTFFSGQMEDDMELRECRESDLPEVSSLYTRYLQAATKSEVPEKHLSALLRPVWEMEPSSFVTLWKRDEMVAFYAMVPLHERCLQLLSTEPLLKRLAGGWKPRPRAYFLAFIGMIPELEDQARTYLLNTIINHFAAAEWVVDFTCLEEWFPIFEYCGFERKEWAEATTEAGTEYRTFVLDLTKDDFITKLDKLIASRSSAASASPREEDGVVELKKIMKNWKQLAGSSPLTDVYAQLFPHRSKTAGSVQDDIMDALAIMSETDDRDAMLSELIKLAYIQNIRPHELVAERLNLSMATYYRHLNKALARLYQLLSVQR
ncbi:ATP-binding protein [Paenibacillus thermotolerans]|uniref:ATP-binding protein n=1 Tax=Paenibacillus thermotolerans TaxID=3027807 RepID=UPI0023677795|nr:MULTISPECIES: ATP-binding protein [unclassified Paenibacillus]